MVDHFIMLKTLKTSALQSAMRPGTSCQKEKLDPVLGRSWKIPAGCKIRCCVSVQLRASCGGHWLRTFPRECGELSCESGTML